MSTFQTQIYAMISKGMVDVNDFRMVEFVNSVQLNVEEKK